MIKQSRHGKQALEVFESMDPVKQALMRASAGQCGMDNAHCSTTTVKDVARVDCPGSMAHAEMSEGVLFTSSMHHRFGLPYDYVKLENFILTEICPCCLAPLRDPDHQPSKLDRFLPGNATRGDAGGTGADSRRTRFSSWQ